MNPDKDYTYYLLEKRALSAAGKIGLKGLKFVGHWINPKAALKFSLGRFGVTLGAGGYGIDYASNKYKKAKEKYLEERYQDRLRGIKHSGIRSTARFAKDMFGSTVAAVPVGLFQHVNHLPGNIIDWTVNGIPTIQNLLAIGPNVLAGKEVIKPWKPWIENTDEYRLNRYITGPAKRNEDQEE